MKTAFRKPPEWHGDEGKQWGYVSLGHVTHFVIDTGEIGFVGGKVSTIAEPQREEMAKALENYDTHREYFRNKKLEQDVYISSAGEITISAKDFEGVAKDG